MGKDQSLASITAREFEPAIPRQPSLLPLRVQTLNPALLAYHYSLPSSHIRAPNAIRRFVAEAIANAKKSGVRTVALLTPSDRVAVSGIWANEDQKLARVRFGFRALTRTLVAFQEAFLTGRDLSPSCRLLLSAVAPYIRLPVAH